MNLNYKQSQFELFPGSGDSVAKVSRPAILFSSITLSLENIVVVSIVMVMAVVLSFSVGVERGKKILFSNNFASSSTEAVSVVPAVKSNLTESPSATTKSIAPPKSFSVPSLPKNTVVDIARKETPQKVAEKIAAQPKPQEVAT